MKSVKVIVFILMIVLMGTVYASAQNTSDVIGINSKIELPTNNITSVEVDGTDIWLASEDKGLIRVSKANHKDIQIFNSADNINFKSVVGVFKNKQNAMWIITDKGIYKYDLLDKKLSLIDARTFKRPEIKKSPDGSLWIKEDKQIFHLDNNYRINVTDIGLEGYTYNFNVDTYGKLWVIKDGKAYYQNNQYELIEYTSIDKYKNSIINGKKVKQYEPQPVDSSKTENLFFDTDGSKWFSITVDSMGVYSQYKLVHLKNDGSVEEYGPFGQNISKMIPNDKNKKIIYAYQRIMTMSSWMLYGELDTKANKISVMVNDANGSASEGAPRISELYSDDKGNSFFRKRELPDDQFLYYIKPNFGLVKYYLQDKAYGYAKNIDSQGNLYVVKEKALHVISPISSNTILGKAKQSSTDAFINGKYIKSYNVLGELAFSIKDLTRFGFEVEYNKDNKFYSIKQPINNNVQPKIFPRASDYFKAQKEKAKGFVNLAGKDIYAADNFGMNDFDSYYQMYMVGTEPVVFAKNIVRYGFNENNNRFEVYTNGLHMQDGYFNYEPLNSVMLDKDYIYAASPKEGFLVLNRKDPNKATRFDTYSNKTLMSDKTRFVAKAASGTILVFNDKGIFTFKPDVKGYFTRISPYLTLDSLKKVKKLYPKLDSNAVYYPDKLRSLYENDVNKFYKEMMNNQDQINGIYTDDNAIALINTGGYRFYPISKEKEKIIMSFSAYELAIPNGYIYLPVRYMKIDLNKLNKGQKVKLFTSEAKPISLNWQIISKENSKDGNVIYTVLNENKNKILLYKTPNGVIKIQSK